MKLTDVMEKASRERLIYHREVIRDHWEEKGPKLLEVLKFIAEQIPAQVDTHIDKIIAEAEEVQCP